MAYEIKDVEDKILEIAKNVGVNVEFVRDKIEMMKRYKRKIVGVWSSPGWLWIATEQDTKFTFAGWTFSPMVPEGEYGSWYIWEVEKLKEEIPPKLRWRPEKEEIERMRKMIEEIL